MSETSKTIERWAVIPEYDGRYFVSNLGAVRTTIRNRNLKTHDNGAGYRAVYLYDSEGRKLCKLVHRLVAQAFIKNPNNYPTVNHKDGDKTYNHEDNLEWMTHKQNMQHASETGILKRRKKRTRLQEEDVLNIRALKGKATAEKIAEYYNVTKKTVYAIQNRRTWIHI